MSPSGADATPSSCGGTYSPSMTRSPSRARRRRTFAIAVARAASSSVRAKGSFGGTMRSNSPTSGSLCRPEPMSRTRRASRRSASAFHSAPSSRSRVSAMSPLVASTPALRAPDVPAGPAYATRMASLAAGAGTGLLVFLGAVPFDATAVDLAAPGTGRSAPLLDELLETVEVTLDTDVIRAENLPDPLRDVRRRPVQLELDLRLVLAERDEVHDPLVPRARCAPPDDDFVGNLLGDLGIPLLDLAGDPRAPVQPLVVELLDRFDTFHEPREFLELGPVVVRDPDRNVDFEGFVDCRHGNPASACLRWLKPYRRNSGASFHGCDPPVGRVVPSGLEMTNSPAGKNGKHGGFPTNER